MSFPRYSEYKDSGFDLLGPIPASWDVKRVKYLLRDGYEGLKIGPFGSQLTSDMLVDGGPYRVYGQENVIADDFERGSRRIDESKFIELSVYEIRPGDVLITMMGTSGRCAVVPDLVAPGVMDSHLLRMRLGEMVFPEFLRTLIDESDYVKNQVKLLGKGSIMHGLNSAVVKELLVALPSTKEQQGILGFLREETAKIDGLIGEQENLIALLKEKRQAVISHAVTKGLDPNVPMKDSGIEWLGEVPAHWEVVPLSRITLEKCDGPFGSGLKSEHYSESGVRVIRLQNIRRDGFDGADAAYIDEHYYRSLPGHDVVSGDVLIAGLGDDNNTLGRACVAPSDIEPAMVKADCFRFRLNTRVSLPAFIAVQLTAGSEFDAGVLATGTTRSRIPLSLMATRRVALPPLSEQKAISEFLSGQALLTDSLLAQAASGIVLLKERRAALISAAVTGKIDVRQYKATEAA